MYFDRIPSNNELETNTTTTNSIVESSSSASATAAKTSGYIRNEIDASIAMFMVWIVVWSIVSLILFKFIQKLTAVKIKGLSIYSSSQIPCRNCKFFTDNRYLKCAVRPSTVLTKQAIECSEFCGKHESYLQANCPREVQHGS